MGRNPKIRVHYDADAQYLLRMKHAIEMDGDRPIAWRREAIELIQNLVECLIQVPAKIPKVANE